MNKLLITIVSFLSFNVYSQIADKEIKRANFIKSTSCFFYKKFMETGKYKVGKKINLKE